MSSTSGTAPASESGAYPTQARLSLILLLYYLGVVLVVTLAPFRFAVPMEPWIHRMVAWDDLIANVLLFVPLGFLYPLSRLSEREPSLAWSFLLGLVLSSAIETAQLYELERFPSIPDVLSNATGAWAGSLLQRVVARRIHLNASLVGRLSLELPLMGLIYLIVPLMWLGSLGVQGQPARLLTLVPLGLFGGRLLSDVHRYHFGPAGALSTRGIGAVAGGWMVLGTFPVLLQYPWFGVAVAAGLAVVVSYEAVLPETVTIRDRRFEAFALDRAAPYMVVYILTTILLPVSEGAAEWRWSIGLSGFQNTLSVADQLRVLEPIAALTVLGYLLGEARGRLELSYAQLARRLLLECGMIAILIEAGRGFQPGGSACLVLLFLLTAAGMFGGGIYHMQRDHVRWLLAKDGPAEEPQRSEPAGDLVPAA